MMSEKTAYPALWLHDVSRAYQQGDTPLVILDKAELALWPGQSVALVAPSGAGKSTLLHIAGLLEKPDSGDVFVNGVSTAGMDDGARAAARRVDIGFVYQFHHLLPEFTAIENVMLPQMIRGLTKAEAKKRGSELLDFLGLGHRLTHRPAELSGGEQQRVAIARAFAPRPTLVLADEPTGNLDAESGRHVADLLFTLVRDANTTLMLVTHDAELANRCDRVVHMVDGQIAETR